MHVNADEDVLAQAAAWRGGGHAVALATVIGTWGSAPRAAGSHMAICDTGAFVGSVSGGCVEGAVVHEAREIMESGEPKVLEYGVTDDMAWEVGLACGGRVSIYVEPVS
ncbi:MAG: XdhC family protein [Gemmatimonadota bacterium]|nr:XdhC family protein [Gemmatimonadota bacterium]MDH5758040.1 XdhC family protein [Gemmatimonadota bacterium]